MILRRKKPAKMGVREDERFRSEPHLQFVRGFECLCAASGECNGRMEAHHNRENGNGGGSLKPGDEDAVPLCLMHHNIGHLKGWKTFEQKYDVDLDQAAERLAKLSPHFQRWQWQKRHAEELRK